jgi:hypothetical protein
METRMPQTADPAPINPPNYTPAWWTDRHTSSWERVKDAFRRDWEQTKADLSGDTWSLNQNAGDTVMQALGNEPVPPPGVKTRPTDPKDAVKEAAGADAKAAEDAAKRNLEAAKAAAQAQVKNAERHVDAVKDAGKAREAMAKESAKAVQAIDKASANIVDEHARMADAVAQRDAAVVRWRQAEQEARYGYAVRSQYPTVNTWDDALEGKLRTEWETLKNGRSWEESRAGVRRGWDYASRSH